MGDEPARDPRRCDWCRRLLPADAHPRRIYCSHRCGQWAWIVRTGKREAAFDEEARIELDLEERVGVPARGLESAASVARERLAAAGPLPPTYVVRDILLDLLATVDSTVEALDDAVVTSWSQTRDHGAVHNDTYGASGRPETGI